MPTRFLTTTAAVIELHRRVSSHLARYGASTDLADEIAAEALERVWEKLHKGFEPTHPEGYLRQVAHNLWIDHLRQQARERAGLQALAARELLHTQVLAEHGDAEIAALEVSFEQARRCLPLRFQQVLVCAIDLDMSPSVIAETLGLSSSGSAAVLVFRARRALWAALEGPT